MNKVVKGTIAAAAAVALFGGGAGSLAYWQASASTDALTLQMGYVQIDAGARQYSHNGVTASYDDVVAQRMVPGDVVVYQQDFFVQIGGTETVLRVSPLDLGDTSSAVLDAIDTSMTIEGVDGSSIDLEFTATNQARAYNASGTGTVRVTITISVPEGLEDGGSMVGGIFVQPLPVTLTQVTEPLPDAEG